MTFNLTELQLSQKYEFNVNVGVGNNKFAGWLALSPERITLKIMGERNDERDCPLNFTDDVDELVCEDLNKTFILRDLKFISGQSRLLRFPPKPIGYFEKTYHVGYVMFCPSGIPHNDAFVSISIHSKTVCEWIGNTITQENIIMSHHKGERIIDDPSKLAEFVVDIKGLGHLAVLYDLSIYSSSPDFKSGIFFPPYLSICFRNEIKAQDVKRLYDKIYNLFTFLTGDELLVDKIKVGAGFNNAASLYYPSGLFPKRKEHSCIFYPLGKDLRYDSLKLPPMPLDVFSKYFHLNNTDSEYWVKYLKYKRMENVEERFLGYFRILEALCHKQKNYLDDKLLSELITRVKPYLIKKFKDIKNVNSFLKGLPHYNNSKYNTAKCIQDFFSLIPAESTKCWKFMKKDIDSICKLRNDITHANDYYVNETEIYKTATLIEILIIFSLCSKIGIALDITAKLIHRLNGYFLIDKN
jgi:hypothetical protein